MKKKILSKIIGAVLCVMTCIALNPVSAHAEWKQNSTGWWYKKGKLWAIGWEKINNKWYYFDYSGYMKTGWLQYNGQWYYLSKNGDMVFGQIIDGYAINNDGIWINDYKYSPKEAEDLMLKNDGEFVKNMSKEYRYVIREIGVQYALKNNYGISERVYAFYFENDSFGPAAIEFIGMDTGNVYRVEGNSGAGTNVKKIQNNKIVQEFSWKE